MVLVVDSLMYRFLLARTIISFKFMTFINVSDLKEVEYIAHLFTFTKKIFNKKLHFLYTGVYLPIYILHIQKEFFKWGFKSDDVLLAPAISLLFISFIINFIIFHLSYLCFCHFRFYLNKREVKTSIVSFLAYFPGRINSRKLWQDHCWNKKIWL